MANTDDDLRGAIADLLGEMRQRVGERRRSDDVLELLGELRGTTAVLNAQLTDWRAENGRLLGAQDVRLGNVERDVRELRDWRWRTVGMAVGLSTLLPTAVAVILATATHH